MRSAIVLACLVMLTQNASAGLLADYQMTNPFGNGTDNVTDSSPNGFDADGKFSVSGDGSVANFNGDNGPLGWIKLPNADVGLGLEGAVRMTINRNPNDSNAIDYLWYQDETPGGQTNKKAFFLQGNNLIGETNGPGGTFEISTPFGAFNNTSTEVMFTWSQSAGTGAIWINGSPAVSGALAANKVSTGTLDTAALGRHDGVGNHHFLGSMDNVMLSDNYIPEPTTVTLLGFGALTMIGLRRRS